MGLGLAVLPVPLLMAAFRWLDRVEPGPWRNLIFSFAWGACAAALVAIIANSFATRWIATATADPGERRHPGGDGDRPVVEESAKAAAALLIFLFRRREFSGVVDGIVVAGFTATGFAFTENILYLGSAFGEDQQLGSSGFASATAGTFFVRIVMSPFAHPLFTVLTGLGSASRPSAPAATGSAGSPCRCWVCRWRWGCTPCGTARRAFGPYGFSRGVRDRHGPGVRPGDLAGDLVAPAELLHARRRAARVRRGRLAHPRRAVGALLHAGPGHGPRSGPPLAAGPGPGPGGGPRGRRVRVVRDVARGSAPPGPPRRGGPGLRRPGAGVAAPPVAAPGHRGPGPDPRGRLTSHRAPHHAHHAHHGHRAPMPYDRPPRSRTARVTDTGTARRTGSRTASLTHSRTGRRTDNPRRSRSDSATATPAPSGHAAPPRTDRQP